MAPDLSFLGPGSQPDEGDGVLQFMEMPKSMATFHSPALPEPEDAAMLNGAKAALHAIVEALAAWTPGNSVRVPLDGLDKANLAFVDQALGEGEVSVVCGSDVQVQESVLAGVWRVRTSAPDGRLVADAVEVGAFPMSVRERLTERTGHEFSLPRSFGPEVFNAPPLLTEIGDQISKPRTSQDPHVINLSLLPHTEADLLLIDETLGRGIVTALSRGYGNCRVMSTGVAGVWWVRFYNSQDTLILNSIEVVDVPEVVCAAPEDIADSHERLVEILKVYQ